MKVGLFLFSMFTVYILYSAKLGQFYKGQTSNLPHRLERHNRAYEQFTSKGIPWRLLWSTQKRSRSEAKKLERKLKNLGNVQLMKFILKYEDGVVGPDELLLIKQLSGC